MSCLIEGLPLLYIFWSRNNVSSTFVLIECASCDGNPGVNLRKICGLHNCKHIRLKRGTYSSSVSPDSPTDYFVGTRVRTTH